MAQAIQNQTMQDERNQRLMNRLIFGVFVVLSLYFFALLFLRPEYLEPRLVIIGSILLFFGVCYGLNQKGHTSFAAFLMIVCLFLGLSASQFMNYNNESSLTAGFIVLVYCTGFILGKRSAYYLTSAIALMGFLSLGYHNQLDFSSLEAGLRLYQWVLNLVFLSGALLVLHLITDSLSAQQEQLEERAFLIEQVADAFITVNIEGRILTWNKGAEMLYGWQAEEVYQRTFDEIVLTEYPDSSMSHVKAYADLFANGNWQGEVVQIAKDGRKIPVQSSVSLVYDATGKVRGMVAVNRDVSAYHELAKREIYEKVLENELKNQHQLNSFKDRILSTVSHEFRTPLTVIQSSLEIIRRYSDKLSPAQQLERLDRIQRQAQRLTYMVTDVLALARTQSHHSRPKPEKVQLAEFCAVLVSDFSISNPARDVIFTTENMPNEVLIEKQSLEHIFTNLISNALKYSPEDKSVRIKLGYENEQVVFSVKDEGIGIPQEDQKHLFEAFHRASNVGERQGTGIGLSIVKHTVQNLGGTINFHSIEGKGSCFEVRLPMTIVEEVEMQAV